MHNEDDMKRKGDAPATKDGLDRLAANMNLERFATKDDLARFATKDDLERFATKDDWGRFAAESSSRMDEMASVVRRQSVRIVNSEASVDARFDEVMSAFKGMESRLTGRMDDFMSNTLRVDRDNILLNHRMDKVEGRISGLERPAP